jgi:hemolysin activation/secretion protein
MIREPRLTPRLTPLFLWAFAAIAASPAFAADAPASATAEAAPIAPAAAAAPAPHFDLNELRVLGNTVLDPRTIESTVYPFLGPDRTLKDVESARVALEGVYHQRGYGTVFVDIPEQSVEDDGIVRLHVTEARLRKVTTSGARYFSGRQIRAAVPEATAGTVPHLVKLQEQIAAVNAEQRDRVVVPVLKAGTEPGTVDLALNVQDSLPFHGSLEVNNQYTADTDPLRVMLLASYDNLFGRFDSLSLQYQTAPQDRDQVDVLAFGYVASLGDSSNKLSLTYVDSSSAVATVGTLGVTGKGKVYGARFIHTLTATAASIAQLSIGPDFKDFAQDVVVDPTSSLSTPIKYTSLSGNFNWLLRQPSRMWTWSTTLNIGIPGLGGDQEQFANKCFRCRANFTVLRMDGSLRQNIFAGFSGLLSVGGQYTADPVISNEQMPIGGAHSIRGYLEAEVLGDIGAHASVELHAPNLVPKFVAERASFLPFVFYDTGRVSYQAALTDQPTHATLRSWGAGFDMSLWNFLTGSLTWADPLLDSTNTHRGDARWEFAVRSSW